jgi:CTP:molybdopterin cytidylyltransferase MocA
MPVVTAATVRRLLEAVGEDGALLVDEHGRQQFLCGVYRTEALLAAAPPAGEQHGLPMRGLVAGLRLGSVPALPGETRDVDTWEDLLALRDQLEG